MILLSRKCPAHFDGCWTKNCHGRFQDEDDIGIPTHPIVLWNNLDSPPSPNARPNTGLCAIENLRSRLRPAMFTILWVHLGEVRREADEMWVSRAIDSSLQ